MIEIIKYVKNYFFSYVKIYKNKKNINFNFKLIKRLIVNNVNVYKLKKCKFNVRSDFIFDLNDKIISETIDHKIRIKLYQKKNFSKKIKFNDNIAILNLSSENHFNYYHFIIDIMFKLFIFKKLNIANYKIILPLYKFNSYRREIFYFFFPNEKKNILLIDSKTEVLCDLAYHIESNFHYKFYTFKEYIAFLRKKIFLNKKIKNKTNKIKDKKIYISRKLIKYRNFVNESKFTNYLKKKGFRTFYFEKLSIIEQFQIFHNADIIVACHGSALTNLIASKKTIIILEIHSGFFADHYTKLSQLIGINKHRSYLVKENSYANFFDYILEKNKNKIVTDSFLKEIDLLLK